MEKQLPKQLLDSLEGLPGFNRESFAAAHQKPAWVSIRKNPFKDPGTLPNESGRCWENTYYLSERPSFTHDPLFHAGCYYVQEASSGAVGSLFTYFMRGKGPLVVLDLCAAPGGKSTDILSHLSKESLLVSNEVIRSRVNALSENITKWGTANTIVTNNDPADFKKLEGLFDVIIVDAPCSGSGLFRKDAEAIGEWSEENVKLCSRRQERILEDVIPALKETGLLIYSTCSYSKEENENICDRIMEISSFDSVPKEGRPLTAERSLSEEHRAAGFRFYPDQFKGEGFFVACFIKKEGPGTLRMKNSTLKKVSSAEKELLEKFIRPDRFTFFRHNDNIHFIHRDHETLLGNLQQRLYIRNAGTIAGKIVHGELVPDHALAMSIFLEAEVPRVNVDKATALKYLGREDIKLSSSSPGWIVICYEGHPLGWAKVLPNRVNNYYPKELRILKSLD
ncbi:MAG TPA: hypothetical protein VI112_04345 [Bacteroidia bacterium]|jgi:16S rRNA C967 or C1407 C5-methylase (RsmB/RsmF family)/NOL1/NOP2/fmu family ribosome biogenesis protein